MSVPALVHHDPNPLVSRFGRPAVNPIQADGYREPVLKITGMATTDSALS